MLMTKDVVKVADTVTKGKVKYHGIFDRPYLSRGKDDTIDSEVIKVDSTDNGTVEYTVTSPKEKTTAANPQDLFQEAYEYFKAQQETDVKDEAKRVDPLLLILQYADDGLVASLRMKKRNELIPAEINEDKARNNAALLLVKNGKFKTVEDALAALKMLGM